MTNSELQQTIAEIWALFRENHEQLAENGPQLELLREESLETERRFQETERLLKEESLKTERMFQQTNQQIQATEQS